MTNVDQAAYWDGEGGERWATDAERYDRANLRFADRIVEALDPKPGERVLDVGCGNGALALAVAQRVGPDGAVVGLDLSGPMLGEARRRAEAAALGNVTFEKGDAQVHPLPEGSFDAWTSRLGVMFFDDPVAAFANLGRALKPGGRVAFACWQQVLVNEWITVPAGAILSHVPMPPLGEPGAPGPFSLADADRVRTLLTSAGLADVELADTKEPMVLGADVEDAVSWMRSNELAQTLLSEAPEDMIPKIWDSVAEALAPYVGPEGVTLSGATWLVTARRPG